jgi:hypothetical protein
LKVVCYGCLQIAGHLESDSRKANLQIPLLALMARDLARPLEEASRVIVEDLLLSTLEGLKRRAISSVITGFFSMSLSSDHATLLLNHDLLDGWLNNTFPLDASKYEQLAGSYVRELFLMTLERGCAPLDVHTSSLPNPHPIVEAEIIGEECTGIQSHSIVNGFKAYHTSIKNGLDVNLEDVHHPDGSTSPVLRSAQCTRKRMRGTVCDYCRLAQNRWAVRLCRLKKAGPKEEQQVGQ